MFEVLFWLTSSTHRTRPEGRSVALRVAFDSCKVLFLFDGHTNHLRLPKQNTRGSQA